MKSPDSVPAQSTTTDIASFLVGGVKEQDSTITELVTIIGELSYVGGVVLSTVRASKNKGFSVVEVDTKSDVAIETVAESIIASSQGKFVKWEYVSVPIEITGIYNKYGKWDKLYLLEDDPNYYLAFNGEFLVLKEDA